MPFASGTPPDRETPLRDTNDSAIIGANLCPTLRSFLDKRCQCQLGPLFVCVDDPQPPPEGTECNGLLPP